MDLLYSYTTLFLRLYNDHNVGVGVVWTLKIRCVRILRTSCVSKTGEIVTTNYCCNTGKAVHDDELVTIQNVPFYLKDTLNIACTVFAPLYLDQSVICFVVTKTLCFLCITRMKRNKNEPHGKFFDFDNVC